ncbi:MAG: DUF4372 domain-containing protein [Verrucomicrobiales bacterium]
MHCSFVDRKFKVSKAWDGTEHRGTIPGWGWKDKFKTGRFQALRGNGREVARETGAATNARDFTVFSHLTTMLFAQLTHAMGLNDLCDSLRLKRAALAGVGAVPPSRNGLSHANTMRSADFIEKLFWRTLDHLQRLDPSFAAGRRGRGLLRRFRVRIHAVDSTVMELVANCMDWAKHRRRKAAAKIHLRLDLHSFTRLFAVVRSALWERVDMVRLLQGYGTAGASFKVLGALQQVWLLGFPRAAS